MNATFTDKTAKFNPNYRKENHFYKQFTAVVFTENKFREAATLRVYATNAKTYACFWGVRTSGTGAAGGYGYHRASAAAGEAIRNAGYVLTEEIDGRGDSEIRAALVAIAAHEFPSAPCHICEAYA